MTSRDPSTHTFDGLDRSTNPSHTKQLQEEEKDTKGAETSSAQNMECSKGAKEREIDNRSDQACEFREKEQKEERIGCRERQEVYQESRKETREVYLNTLKLLLKRGADPNMSRIPVPVLFSAILACDREGIERLLLLGARTDIPLPPERSGLYPLHVAAALPGPAGPEITEMLLHTFQDPDARACDHDEIFERDKVFIKAPQSTNENAHLKEGGRTALHVACQRESDHQNATKVVALLLSHRASTDLLWSGHSPLSLAIATGNMLAVEELLNGGADPNIPLGPSVGSALCAFANIHYILDDTKEKLLQMLVKAGADILMPVMVDGEVGTAMDYAYYSFHQDLRISGTPFSALNTQEQEIFKARCRLLCMMGDLMRQAAHQRGLENLSEKERRCTGPEEDTGPQQQHSSRKPVPKFCYYCGRSVSVRLTPCYRCYKVFYCSRPCRLNAWDELHKNECVRVKAGTHSFESTHDQNGQESSTMINISEEMWRIRRNPRENYTFN